MQSKTTVLMSSTDNVAISKRRLRSWCGVWL